MREAGADKFTVLASPSLLNRLQSDARRAEMPADGAALVSADYEGKADDSTAQFKAEFHVYCVGDGTTVHLPIGGVQLDGETLLDGSRVYPTAAKPPMTMSHAGRTLLSGSARLRGPVAQGKPVAGLTV